MDRNDHALEAFKGLHAIANEGLKAIMLINGGAATAVLAYLGHTQDDSIRYDLGSSMLCFIVGVAATAVAWVLAYLTQLQLHNENMGRKGTVTHVTYLRCGLLAVIVSIGAFGLGSWWGVSRLAG